MRMPRDLLAIALALAGASVLSAAVADDGIVSLAEGWQLMETSHEPEPTRLPSEPDALSDGMTGEIDRWYTRSLPGALEGERLLLFASYRGRIEVWIDDDVVYRFENPDLEGLLAIHTVPLKEPGGRTLSLRLPLVGYGSSIESGPLLVVPDRQAVAMARLSYEPFRRDLGRIIAAAILLVVAVVSMVVSLVRRRLKERVLLYFGLFTMIYGVRLMLDTVVAPMLGLSQLARWYLMSGLTYLINVPATFLVLSIFGRGWRSSLLWVARASVVLCFLGVMADLATDQPFALNRVNNLLVISNGVLLVVNLVHLKAFRSKDGFILTGGLVAFGILALIENLRGLFDVFQWSDGIEWIGFIALMGALGWVALRRFLAGEAELIEIGKELEMARSIQSSILPDAPPASERLEVRARYIPMTAVAGDFYDYYKLPDGKIGVLVADVSGHGVPAAMVASMVKVAASTHAAETSDPAELVSALNQTLCHHLGREFVTVTWMVFDPGATTVRICNAGHPPPLRLTNGTVLPLGGFGILVGKFRDASYETATVDLEEGDRILCFTDGITEAANASEEEYGSARLEAALTSYRHLDLDLMLDELVAEVKWWSGKAQQGDDLTLVGIDVGMATSRH